MALSSVLTHTYVYTQTKAYIHLIQLLMHPLTNRPHTLSHTHKQALTSVLLPLLCASPVAGPSLQSVIAASVAWTDRRTGDWRWHAPIISGPSAVFAITESLAEHTESDSGSLYSGAISTPTGCTASVDHSLAGLGLSINLKNCFWWSLDRISESGLHFFLNVWIKSPTIQMSSFFFFCSTQVTEAGKINKVVKKAAWLLQGLMWTAWRQSRKEEEGQTEHCQHVTSLQSDTASINVEWFNSQYNRTVLKQGVYTTYKMILDYFSC